MTDPTPLPPRRRVETVDEAIEQRMSDAGRRLDAREMDQLAKDARNILSRAVDAQSSGNFPTDPLDHVFKTPPAAPVKRDLNDLGRMSAEAVSAQYEEAATAFEAMGREAKERIAAIAGSLIELDKDLKAIADTAAAIRDKGHRVKLQIEEASALSVGIRDSAIDVKKKLGL